MLRDYHTRPLKHLGVDRNNYKVLKLLPLVYVAWATGAIQKARRERILQLANGLGVGVRGEAVLREWLRAPPTAQYFREGFQELLRLARAPDEWEFDLDELQMLVAQAEAIARTTPVATDQLTNVSDAEEEAIGDLSRELEVDDGETWSRLVRQLSDGSSSHGVPR
jgi:hypothetical protein